MMHAGWLDFDRAPSLHRLLTGTICRRFSSAVRPDAGFAPSPWRRLFSGSGLAIWHVAPLAIAALLLVLAMASRAFRERGSN